MQDAAEMAGFNVLQLIHENTAVATMFGLDRNDANKTHTVLFYNMGGKDTEVSVVQYSTVEDAKGKNYEHIEILAEAWDETLGSTEIDRAIMREMVSRFDSQPERKGKPSVAENKRAMKRLQKDCIKAKETLSANREVQVKLAELDDYDTLNTKLTRDELE